MVKNPPANAGDAGDWSSIPGLGRFPSIGKWQPTPVFLPGKCHGRGAWWDTVHGTAKELDATKHARTQSSSYSHKHYGV